MNVSERIEYIEGDITTMDVDAIVNAANSSLLGGGGVDGAIHSAAGPELLKECRKTGGCPTGEARITKAYNLKARHVIHTVGPVYKGKKEDSILLSNCYKNCLNLAMENGLSTIAFPAISCGVYGYPIHDASVVAIKTTADFLKKNDTIKKITFVLFSRKFLKIYRNCSIK